MTDAVTAFQRGAIDAATYQDRLNAALMQLGGYEDQIRAKMGNPPDDTIPAAEGAVLLSLKSSIFDAIVPVMGISPEPF